MSAICLPHPIKTMLSEKGVIESGANQAPPRGPPHLESATKQHCLHSPAFIPVGLTERQRNEWQGNEEIIFTACLDSAALTKRLSTFALFARLSFLGAI